MKSFAGTESVWVFKDGLISLINNISQMRHSVKLSSAFLKDLKTFLEISNDDDFDQDGGDDDDDDDNDDDDDD